MLEDYDFDDIPSSDTFDAINEEANSLTDLISMADLDITKIKDDLVRAEADYRRLTFDLLRCKLAEIRAAGALSVTQTNVEIALRNSYEAAGGKKPTEAAIKADVLIHPDVVAAAEAATDASNRTLVAKAKVDVVAKRESIARSIASLLKAELNSLD